MKKVVRLTESDLIRIVKRVINEGESEEIYEKLVEKLKQNEFKSEGLDSGHILGDGNDWETDTKNNMSVVVQFSQGYYIFATVIIDGVGYGRPRGTLYDSKIVDDAIYIANMIKKGVDKNTIKMESNKKGFTK